EPAGRPGFACSSLTYYPARLGGDRMAYLTLFPVGAAMRANFMVYRDLHDPWLREMRQRPKQTLRSSMPGLTRLTGDFAVIGPVKVRPADLYVTTGYRRSGIVLVGDAF